MQLAALYHLTVLNLAGTQMRMVSLRYLCETWKSSRNLDLTVPSKHTIQALYQKTQELRSFPYRSTVPSLPQ